MDMVYRSQYKQEDVGMYLSEVWDTLHQADTIHVTIANPLSRGGLLFTRRIVLHWTVPFARIHRHTTAILHRLTAHGTGLLVRWLTGTRIPIWVYTSFQWALLSVEAADDFVELVFQ